MEKGATELLCSVLHTSVERGFQCRCRKKDALPVLVEKDTLLALVEGVGGWEHQRQHERDRCGQETNESREKALRKKKKSHSGILNPREYIRGYHHNFTSVFHR